MNTENEKLEEARKEDIGETLPSSKTVSEIETDGESENNDAIPELNSNAQPTEEQVEEAIALEEETEPKTTEEHYEGSDEEAEFSESVDEPSMTDEQEAFEKMLTQSQVDEIVGRTRTETRDKTRAETQKGIYDRYGVSDEAGMDSLVGNAQKYEMLHEDYENTLNQLKEANIKLAMYDSGIAPERYEDARLILQGKGMDVTAENIRAEMETHPEWKKNFKSTEAELEEVNKIFKPIEKNPASTITRLGNEKPEAQPAMSEKDLAMSLFKQ